MAKAKTAPEVKAAAKTKAKLKAKPKARPKLKRVTQRELRAAKPFDRNNLPTATASAERIAQVVQSRFERQGRPTLYRPNYAEIAYRHLTDGGLVEQLADIFDVSVATLYEWKAKHPGFFEALTLGKLGFDQQIERALHEKALGATYTDQTAIKLKDVEFDDMGKKLAERERIEIVTLQKSAPPDTTAMIFWLKNRRPHEWRDRTEITGADGGAIDTNVNLTVKVGTDLMRRLSLMSGRIEIDHDVTDVEPE